MWSWHLKSVCFDLYNRLHCINNFIYTLLFLTKCLNRKPDTQYHRDTTWHEVWTLSLPSQPGAKAQSLGHIHTVSFRRVASWLEYNCLLHKHHSRQCPGVCLKALSITFLLWLWSLCSSPLLLPLLLINQASREARADKLGGIGARGLRWWLCWWGSFWRW